MLQPLSDRTDAELIDGCLSGSREAWDILVLRYKRLIFSIPRKWGLPVEDAKEIFQAVWLDCFRELHSLRNLERLQPWLIRIAVRKCYRFSQDRRSLPAEVGLDDIESDANFVDRLDLELVRRVELEQLVRSAVSGLSPRCQQVIEALFFENPNPTYADIAQRFDLSENSIGFTRNRCLDRLATILEDLGYEP